MEIFHLVCDAAACGCGRGHAVHTKRITIGSGALDGLGGALAAAGFTGRALIVADPNTWMAAGERAEASLKASGYGTARFIFPAGELHTDEYAVGSVLMETGDDTGFLLAVGSGTLNDICRFVARRTGMPYAVAATAPSMDGYASAVSPAVRLGFKMTFPGVAPLVIAGDTDVLREAPLKMTAAGFGDIFGKVTALMDWRMSAGLTGEYHCEAVAARMRGAADACMAAAPGLKNREAEAVEGLMRALVLSGIAMQMAGDSRPASGAEHQVAHFLEMRDMARGRRATLHGDKVGMAELMMMRLYEKFFSSGRLERGEMGDRGRWESAMRRELGAFSSTVERQRCSDAYFGAGLRDKVLEGIERDWEYWRSEARGLPALRRAGEEHIRGMGGPVRPADLGYGRDDTRLALKYAMELRGKFTILRLAQLSGRLEGLAEELADEFC